MSGKYALIIGNNEYTDSGLAQLRTPGKDAEDFARVLKDKEIGAFDDVKVIVNESSASVIEAIDEFFDQKKPDDMLVLYFSGHGIKDEIGSLYLAFKNTIRSRLRSTAIKSDYIKEAMDQSRSKRQVLILDCCNSGAFPQGTKAELGGAMGMTQAFQGYGRFVLTASDATQFAWEGDKVIGETDNSLFTHFLVKGLEGDADSDSDGRITVDELYDYAYGQISKVTPKQTPTKSSSKVEGEIVLRQSTRIEDIKPVPLPSELIDEVEDTRPYVREAAVQKLEKIIKGRNIGLAHSAREALEKIVADENTTRRVAQAATQVLESIQKAEQLTIQKEADEQKLDEEQEAKRIALQKKEVQRIVNERNAEAERREKEKAERYAAQKAEEERIAKAKLEAELLTAQKAKEEADRLTAQKAEQERIAANQAEAERKAKEETDRLVRAKAEREETEKGEREAMELAVRRKTDGYVKEKVVASSKATKPSWMMFGLLGGAIIGLVLCGVVAIKFLPAMLAGAPVATQAPTEINTSPIATQISPSLSDNGLLKEIKNRGYILVSTDPNYEPQSFLNTSGKRPADTKCPSDALTTAEMQGFDVDVAIAVGDALGVETCFATPSWDTITAGNWADKWDVSVGSMTITTERQKILDFSVPYYYTPAVVAVLSNSGITSLDQLAGKAICAGVSTTYEAWLNSGDIGLPVSSIYAQPPSGITVVPLESDQECAQALAAGRTDFQAYATSQTVLNANIAAGIPVMQVDTPVYSEDLAAAFDKSSTLPTQSLRTEVDKLFTAMHSDGRLTELSNKWFKEDLTQAPTSSMPNIVRAHMASDKNDTQQTTVYTTDAPSFYCYFDLNNASDTTVVKGTWTLISAEGYESNSEIDSAENTGGDNTYYFNLNRSGDPWPVGKYKIDLYIDGKMVQTVEFEVR